MNVGEICEFVAVIRIEVNVQRDVPSMENTRARCDLRHAIKFLEFYNRI